MKQTSKIALLLLLIASIFFISCNRNYSGGGKSKNCGCPGQKGNGGW